MRERVLNVHNSHLWACDNPHAVHKGGYQVHLSIVWAGIRGIAVAPCLLHYRLTAEQFRELLETVLPGLLEDVPLTVRQRLWFRQDGELQHAQGKLSCSG
jgi:hypothetical protein